MVIDIWVLTGTITGVIVVYFLAIALINRSTKSRRFPADAVNGVKLILRFISVFIIIIVLFLLFSVPAEVLISFTTITGVVIGFASTHVMSQVISGIYLISAGPFGVYDLVKIGGTVGLVLEIGMNYTVLQRLDRTNVKVPNKKMLESPVTNFTIKMTDEIKKRQEAMPYSKHDTEITQDNIKKGKIAWTKLWNVLGEMSEFVFEQEITRFTFDIDLDFALEPHETMQKLDSICRNYTFVYGYRPRYMVNDLSYRAKIKVQIYCPDPVLIINNHDSFMGDIIEALHGTSIKKEGDTK